MDDRVKSGSPASIARRMAFLASISEMFRPKGGIPEGSRMRHARGPAKKGMHEKRRRRNQVRDRIAKASRKRNR